MTDEPEITEAEQRAMTELARRLRGWATGMQDPYGFARAYITALRAEGWRPPLREVPDWHPTRQPPGAGADPNREYLEARARQGRPGQESA